MGWSNFAQIATGENIVDLAVVQHWDGRIEVLMARDDGSLWSSYQLFDKWAVPLVSFPRKWADVGFRGWSEPAVMQIWAGWDLHGSRLPPIAEGGHLPPIAEIGTVSVAAMDEGKFRLWLSAGLDQLTPKPGLDSVTRAIHLPVVSTAGRPLMLMFVGAFMAAGPSNYAPFWDGPPTTPLWEIHDPIDQYLNWAFFPAFLDGPNPSAIKQMRFSAKGAVTLGPPGVEQPMQWNSTFSSFDPTVAASLVGHGKQVLPWSTRKIDLPVGVGAVPYLTLWGQDGLFALQTQKGSGPNVDVFLESVWSGSGAVADFAVAWRAGQVAFIATNDGCFVHLRQEGAAVAYPSPAIVGFPGSFSAVACARNASGRLEVFAVSEEDGTVPHAYENLYSSGWKWHPMSSMGIAALKIRTGVNVDGRIELLVLGTDGNVYHAWQEKPY